VVYAGAGNNGGDGYVVARHLANAGAVVTVIACAPRDKLRGDALVHALACERSGAAILDGAGADGLADAAARTADADVVVDALLGTGLERPVAGHLADAIARINTHRGIKVAVDVPSGLDSDRGVPLGACVRADHTVTFAFVKRGLAVAPGFAFAGQVHVADIGIPEPLARARGVRAELLDDGALAAIAPLDPQAHKGTRGHLLIVAGSLGKSGAALLAGESALRAGAGLTTLCAPDPLRATLDGRIPELMTAWYPPDPPDAAWRAIESILDGKRALAIGPGIATDAAMRALVGRLCAAARDRDLCFVLDADGLNHLAADAKILEGARPGRVVLTPHPGEAARLLGRSTAAVQEDRIAAAEAIARRFGAVTALKGARTVIAAPDGKLAVCPTGNPGLGTGGTGDVLTGCIGALLAQGLDAWQAATAGVYWHGAAGDRCAEQIGARGFTAGDVARALPPTLAARTG
jgi:NAD(P)H-hydrate epimerase